MNRAGLLASIVADSFSNPARVIKTYKQVLARSGCFYNIHFHRWQTSMEQISYISAIQQVCDRDQTSFANCMQRYWRKEACKDFSHGGWERRFSVMQYRQACLGIKYL